MKKNNNEKGQNNCQKLFLKLIHLIAQYIYIYIYIYSKFNIGCPLEMYKP